MTPCLCRGVLALAATFLALVPTPSLGAELIAPQGTTPPAAAFVTNAAVLRRSTLLDRLASAVSPRLRSLDAERDEAAQRLVTVARPINGPTSDAIGFHSQMAGSPASTKWVQVDLGDSVPIDLIALVPAHVVVGNYPGPGYGFPERFKLEISSSETFEAAEVLADHTGEDFRNPGDFPVVVEARQRRARYVRVTATKLWHRAGSCALALGELVVLSGDRNVAIGCQVTASDHFAPLPQWSLENLVDGQSVLGLPVEAAPSPSNGYHSYEWEKDQSAVKWVQVDLGQPRPIDEVRLIPARPRDYAFIPGFGFPLRFRIEASDEPLFSSPVVLRAEEERDYRNPGENPVIIPCAGATARFVRVTATRLWLRGDYYAFALAELQVFAGSTNLALGAPVTALDSVEGGFWSTKAVVDGFSSQQRLVDFSSWLRSLGQGAELEFRLQRLNDEQTRLTNAVLRSTGRWSVLTLCAGLLGLGFLGYRYRLIQLLELERLRTRIATDLHDELGTRLTRIGLLSELVERQTEEQHPAKPHVAQISAMTHEMVRTMDEIVWAVNPRNDTLEDLANYVFHFAEEFFRNAPVRCRLDIPADLPRLPLTTEVRHNLFLAVKEALNNLLKHAQAANALVTLALTEQVLTINIQDDGKGYIPGQTRAGGNGLRNMKQRIESIGGSLEEQSEPGKGTSVRFRVKLNLARGKTD